MNNAVSIFQNQSISKADMDAIEAALMSGDLSKLTQPQRLVYCKAVCDSLGLNTLTVPFEYIPLNGKLKLYATKGCAEQLRANKKISIRVVSRDSIEGVYVVTAEASDSAGRVDSSTGAVPIHGLKGEQLANAMMKAETKAKRRVTLSICGLNMLDETEVESIKEQEKQVKPSQPSEEDLPGMLRYGYRIPGHMPDNVKGKMIEDCDPEELRRAVIEIEDRYDGKPIPNGYAVFIKHAEKQVALWENGSTIDGEPPMEMSPTEERGFNTAFESVGQPVCCGKPMMVSKFEDRNIGGYPWYCMGCKKKLPRN